MTQMAPAEDKPISDDLSRASDPEKNVEPGCVLSSPSALDQFEDPDEGLSDEERAKKVSLSNRSD